MEWQMWVENTIIQESCSIQMHLFKMSSEKGLIPHFSAWTIFRYEEKGMSDRFIFIGTDA